MNRSEADKLSAGALAFLRDRNALPVPVAYAVAYHMMENPQGPLAYAIARIVSTGQALTKEIFERLHREFVDVSSENLIGQASDALSVHLDDSLRLIGNGKQATDWFAHEVDEIEKSTQEMVNPTKDQLSGLMESIKTLTTEMGATNADITKALESTKMQVEAIRDGYNRAIEEARTDSLTKIPNRKSFDEALNRDIARATRPSSPPMSLLVLDIDHFKLFNDKFGHPIGDGVIKHVANMLKDSIRGGDIAARIGGEEFAVILSGAAPDVAHTVAERIRLKVSERSLVTKSTKESIGIVTISIGVATLVPGENATSVMERADAALYEAKRGGRNRVCVASEPDMTPAMELTT